MNPRLLEIAKEIAKVNSDIVDLKVRIKHAQNDFDARESELTPAGGWPGTNPETRKLAHDRALAVDTVIQNMIRLVRTYDVQIMQTDVLKDVLEDERRAIEWDIRDDLAKALSGRQDRPVAPEFDDNTPVDLAVVAAVTEIQDPNPLPFDAQALAEVVVTEIPAEVSETPAEIIENSELPGELDIDPLGEAEQLELPF